MGSRADHQGRARIGAARQLELSPTRDRLTHYLFRFPAKFHPPVVRALLDAFTQPHDVVLDPFCGSGTALVEAAVMGRSSIGLDVDPLAVEVTRAKVHRYEPERLRRLADALVTTLDHHRRPRDWYRRRAKQDLGLRAFETEIEPVAEHIPQIPNLHHWFRRYVIVDLGHIRAAITRQSCEPDERRFLEVVFASIIRNASNADPVPVSGLEYTAHMKRRDAEGRIVDPYSLFEVALRKAINAAATFAAVTPSGFFARSQVGDATRLREHVDVRADAVLTSPPYHGAVDYYRRHQLEQFWLGLTKTQAERLELLDGYIGRPKVPQKDRFVRDGILRTALAKEWDTRIRASAPERADAFKHYISAMTAVFEGLADIVTPGGVALFIVGHSKWNGTEIPTTDLFEEISGDSFYLDDLFNYPVKNRYMSYKRGNGADISTEYVLVLRHN